MNVLSYPLLSSTRDRRATDPRDKMYGLLGIAKGQSCIKNYCLIDAYYPTVDYALPVLEVYLEAAKACMLMQGPGARTDFLRHAGHPVTSSHLRQKCEALPLVDTWPSWLPDWSIFVDPLLPYEYPTFHHDGPSASGRYEPDARIHECCQLEACEHVRRRCLSVRGVRVESIDMFIDSISKRFLLESAEPYPTTNTLKYWEAAAAIDSQELDPFTQNLPKRTGATRFWDHIRGLDPILKQRISPIAARARRQREQYRATKEEQRERHEGDVSELLWSTFFTTGGFLGQGPSEAQEGDEIAIIFGAQMPFIIRRDLDGHYLLIGECFVHGLMRGESTDDLDDSLIETLCFW
jgi:hypothetical protein